ncbi:MAG TPA: VCBS repeat-containing protein, partial [Thermoanaerobaculia bacterium]
NSPAAVTAVWFMAPGGATRTSAASITPATGAPWDIVGVGDMNNDGDSDLIWQASTTRTVAVWTMNQTARSSAAVTSTINDPNWTLVAPR